jgi:hypothetical protein
MFQDLRYAIVMARRNVGFAAAALITLALGIGATTTLRRARAPAPPAPRFHRGRHAPRHAKDAGERGVVRQYLGGPAVGRQFADLFADDRNTRTEIVGIVGNVLKDGNDRWRRELGIRAAIGADGLDLVRVVLRESLGATVIGVGVGLLVASWLTQFMRATLFGVAPLDTVAFAAAPLVLTAAAALACIYPAYRAASTDPAVALRAD